MSGLLAQMTQSSQTRLEEARAREPEKALWARACDMPPAPPLRLSPEGFDVIAECKLHSPSAGDLSANTSDVESRVTDYACGGACAVSVLTEPLRFGGKLEHLTQSRARAGASQRAGDAQRLSHRSVSGDRRSRGRRGWRARHRPHARQESHHRAARLCGDVEDVCSARSVRRRRSADRARSAGAASRPR